MSSRRAHVLVLVLAFLSLGARNRVVQHPAHVPPADVFTFSQPDKIRVTHVSLDLTVDFEKQQLRGSATLDLDNRAKTRTLVLDSERLDVTRVVADGAPAKFAFGSTLIQGSRALSIEIEPTTKSVTIDYATGPNASGLLWNTAEQSFGRQQPYLYTQNEPISARSWIPIQDTPTVRMTYDATIRVPRGMLALMSAENPLSTNDLGIYRFRMPENIPAYLIALGVARLEFRELSARTGIYAEPELIEDAVHDLHYIPAMVAAAERILGPYPFGRYDILLMPPIYIAGGMEHPRLNFIHPLQVVNFNRLADPPPASLIAHELAHAWAGDATTLGSWNDVWLNEGITSYLTIRILEEMRGAEYAELVWYRTRANYEAQVKNANGNTKSFLLHNNYATQQHPGQAFNSHAYTKGALFIRTLEDRIGRATFDAFLRDYFERFSFRWVDDRAFLDFLRQRVLMWRVGLEAELKLDEWIYQGGLPDNLTAPTSSRIEQRVALQANAFSNGTHVSALDLTGWSPSEMDMLLDFISPAAYRSRMAELDAFFHFSTRATPPVSWLINAGYSDYRAAWPAIERYLLRGGGSIVTVYTALASTSAGRTKAIEIYKVARLRYTAAVRAQLDPFFVTGNLTQEAA